MVDSDDDDDDDDVVAVRTDEQATAAASPDSIESVIIDASDVLMDESQQTAQAREQHQHRIAIRGAGVFVPSADQALASSKWSMRRQSRRVKCIRGSVGASSYVHPVALQRITVKGEIISVNIERSAWQRSRLRRPRMMRRSFVIIAEDHAHVHAEIIPGVIVRLFMTGNAAVTLRGDADGALVNIRRAGPNTLLDCRGLTGNYTLAGQGGRQTSSRARILEREDRRDAQPSSSSSPVSALESYEITSVYRRVARSVYRSSWKRQVVFSGENGLDAARRFVEVYRRGHAPRLDVEEGIRNMCCGFGPGHPDSIYNPMQVISLAELTRIVWRPEQSVEVFRETLHSAYRRLLGLATRCALLSNEERVEDLPADLTRLDRDGAIILPAVVDRLHLLRASGIVRQAYQRALPETPDLANISPHAPIIRHFRLRLSIHLCQAISSSLIPPQVYENMRLDDRHSFMSINAWPVATVAAFLLPAACGHRDVLRRLAEAFYARVARVFGRRLASLSSPAVPHVVPGVDINNGPYYDFSGLDSFILPNSARSPYARLGGNDGADEAPLYLESGFGPNVETSEQRRSRAVPIPSAAEAQSHKDPKADDSDRVSTTPDTTCTICYSNAIDALFTPCHHRLYCLDCARKWRAQAASFNCPACRAPITEVTHSPCAISKSTTDVAADADKERQEGDDAAGSSTDSAIEVE